MANPRTPDRSPLLDVNVQMAPVNTAATLNFMGENKAAPVPQAPARHSFFAQNSCPRISWGKLAIGTVAVFNYLTPLIGMAATDCGNEVACNNSFGKACVTWTVANFCLAFVGACGYILYKDGERHHPGPAPRSP